MTAPKVTGAPERIYLVCGELDGQDVAWADLARGDDIHWCEDRQFDGDVEYVRADTVADAVAQARRDERERCCRAVFRLRMEFCEANGVMDPDTGAVEFGRGPHADAKHEYVGELEEIEEMLRNLGDAS